MKDAEQINGFIVSVGGESKPPTRVLKTYKPEHVCWLASNESVERIQSIKQSIPDADYQPSDYKVLVENVHKLSHCYRKSVQCTRWIQDRVPDAKQIVVEYTGGTKSMSASLLLATINHGFSFAYTPDEAGDQPENGERTPYLSENPWDLLAVREWSELSSHFNAYQFEACRQVIQEAKQNVSSRQTHLLQAFATVVQAYDAWDKFHHRHSRNEFEKAIRKLNELHELNAAACLEPLLPVVEEHRSFIATLQDETDNLQSISQILLDDLYHNARRRMEEGRWTDAAGRLYRLVEMRGQLEVKNSLNESTSDFPAEKIPDTLRETFTSKYRSNRDGKIKLPLEATYDVLLEHGNSLGETFDHLRKGFRKVQRARNQSILAHGTQPVKREDAEKMLNVVDELVETEHVITFPDLPEFQCL